LDSQHYGVGIQLPTRDYLRSLLLFGRQSIPN